MKLKFLISSFLTHFYFLLARKAVNSVHFGKHRGRTASSINSTSPDQVFEFDPDKYQYITLLYGSGKYLWIVVHSIILQTRIVSFFFNQYQFIISFSYIIIILE